MWRPLKSLIRIRSNKHLQFDSTSSPTEKQSVHQKAVSKLSHKWRCEPAWTSAETHAGRFEIKTFLNLALDVDSPCLRVSTIPLSKVISATKPKCDLAQGISDLGLFTLKPIPLMAHKSGQCVATVRTLPELHILSKKWIFQRALSIQQILLATVGNLLCAPKSAITLNKNC